ncbi:Concanavalin A-like lectin/glucanase [Cordyceps fumosorosea ARSEF 2679]|uniref:Concanavalin A-like lectin/glucanase n=1 Tax=Cordyceps fumosorosea (strain ARSEF 2679) TaxID=1081104 RepID=A0A167Q502_CORFA|nr:Concanavalin A-like lectin/glucanase [Cordyceps fumosorosea ARSEF 2679]OAA57298.1 Concanavalin A-like lectin/glucanase [Cordyceps fumosorosea ARSEF 2679]
MFKSLILALATVGSVAAAPTSSGNLANSVSVPQHKHKRDLTSRGWSGAIQEADSGTWNFVQGTVVLPTLNDQNNPKGSGDIWVGIDGNNCGTAILQTGIVCYGDGSFWVWTEWWQYNMQDYDTNLGVSGGDTVRMTVNATSTTSGTTLIENLTTGKSVSQTFTGETRYPLCESDAEWIVEDFQENGKPVPLVNWGTIEFTNTVASGPGTSVTAAGSELINIKLDDGTIVTQSSVDNDGNVFVKYIGN